MEQLIVSSPAFEEGGWIPVENSARGRNFSPELQIGGIAEKAVSLAIMMDDASHPLFPNFNHWLIWNLPVQERIPGAIPAGKELPGLPGAVQGTAYGKNCYKGPKPPLRTVHTYTFTVYALDCMLSLSEKSKAGRLSHAMKGHILQKGTLSGRFQSPQKHMLQPIGMRNIKTALSVFVCLVFYLLCNFVYGLLPAGDSALCRLLNFLLNRHDVSYACVAAIVSMQSSVEGSVAFGKSRLIGTAVGGVIGIVMVASVPLSNHTVLSYLLVSLGVVITIYICNIIKHSPASAIACIVFLVIVLSIDSGSNAVPYAINRMIDTAIGILISVPINCFIRAPKSGLSERNVS